MKSKAIGTAAEVAVVKFLEAWGCLDVVRPGLAGHLDQGDVLCRTPQGAKLCIQVKAGKAAGAASDEQVAAWLNEALAQGERAKADAVLLVTKRPGFGDLRVAGWRAHASSRWLLNFGDGMVTMPFLDALLYVLVEVKP